MPYVRVLGQLINLAFKTPMMFSFIENNICLEKNSYWYKSIANVLIELDV